MGGRYKTLQPVYALNFVNELYSGTSNFYHHYSIRNVKDNTDCLGGLEFVFIELPNFDPVGLDKDMLVLWLRFLTEIKHNCERISEDLLEDSHIRRASEILEYASFTASELEVYDRYWDAISTEGTLVSERSAKAMEKGKEEGRKEGKEEGRKEGIKQGTQKGKEEGIRMGEENKLRAAVLGFYQNNVSISVIATSLGIIERQVQNIIQNQSK